MTPKAGSARDHREHVSDRRPDAKNKPASAVKRDSRQCVKHRDKQRDKQREKQHAATAQIPTKHAATVANAKSMRANAVGANTNRSTCWTY